MVVFLHLVNERNLDIAAVENEEDLEISMKRE